MSVRQTVRWAFGKEFGPTAVPIRRSIIRDSPASTLTTVTPARTYQRLDALPVKQTVDRVQARIAARFPDRNLRLVAAELASAVDELLIRPRPQGYGVLRVVSRITMVAVGLVLLVGVVLLFRQPTTGAESAWTWISIAESSINDVVFASIAIYFLWQLPERVQRSYDLRALHRLRSLAHVIDMHQLTKDPERFRADFRATDQSIDLALTPSELGNYLDYCSELLSLVGKTAALFAEHTTDPTVLATVEGLESLTTGMARKIWQKIALLPEAGPTPTAVSVSHPAL